MDNLNSRQLQANAEVVLESGARLGSGEIVCNVQLVCFKMILAALLQ